MAKYSEDFNKLSRKNLGYGLLVKKHGISSQAQIKKKKRSVILFGLTLLSSDVFFIV